MPGEDDIFPGMAEKGARTSLGPIDTSTADGVLTVLVHKEFDSGNIHQDWAQSVQVMHPGPFARIVVDCSQCGLLSSTFFAGIMQLQQHFGAQGCPPLVLHQPDPRIVKNLQILRLHTFFTIIPR